MGGTIGRVALGVATGGLSEVGMAVNRSINGMQTKMRQPMEDAQAAEAANAKQMADIQSQQTAEFNKQQAALAAAPRTETPDQAMGQQLNQQQQRLRAGFAQNIKTSPLGLMAAAKVQSPTLSGTTLGG